MVYKSHEPTFYSQGNSQHIKCLNCKIVFFFLDGINKINLILVVATHRRFHLLLTAVCKHLGTNKTCCWSS